MTDDFRGPVDLDRQRSRRGRGRRRQNVPYENPWAAPRHSHWVELYYGPVKVQFPVGTNSREVVDALLHVGLKLTGGPASQPIDCECSDCQPPF